MQHTTLQLQETLEKFGYVDNTIPPHLPPLEESEARDLHQQISHHVARDKEVAKLMSLVDRKISLRVFKSLPVSTDNNQDLHNNATNVNAAGNKVNKFTKLSESESKSLVYKELLESRSRVLSLSNELCEKELSADRPYTSWNSKLTQKRLEVFKALHELPMKKTVEPLIRYKHEKDQLLTRPSLNAYEEVKKDSKKNNGSSISLFAKLNALEDSITDGYNVKK